MEKICRKSGPGNGKAKNNRESDISDLSDWSDRSDLSQKKRPTDSPIGLFIKPCAGFLVFLVFLLIFLLVLLELQVLLVRFALFSVLVIFVCDDAAFGPA